ncbi:MAG TPA: PrsW family intramembrane metalloprotease [Candidatus Corynebacterium gallistercoris]|uniref:PrsW family intramembrane metalloprotease n=1 Tax=Candidatus Corynebacterium gallistercoris TaxID=2838530 RepID=A0A9D1RWY1_9CORY|nr:PrsW family intramembrane metalloprotease [Candidatus Corynebacterium gallistercoris]
MRNYQILDVPRAFHDAQPEQVRPKLTMFKDAWFWIYWLIVVPSLGFMVVLTGAGAYGSDDGVLFVGLFLMVAEIMVVGFVISRLKIAAGTPTRMMVLAVLWGFTGAMGVTLTFGWPISSFAEKMGWHTFVASFGGGYPEEITKALGIWLVLSIGRTWWNRPWHGIVAGMLVGLGFDAYENVLYGLNLGLMHPTSDMSGMLEVFLVRNIFGSGMHVIMSGLVGYGIGQAMFAGRKIEGNGQPGPPRTAAWRLGQVLKWGFAGFASHFAFNMQLQNVDMFVGLAWPVVVWAVSLGGLVIVIVWQTRVLRPALRAGAYPSLTLYRKVGVAPPVPPAWPVPGEVGVASPQKGLAPLPQRQWQPQKAPQQRLPGATHHVPMPEEWK